MVRLEEIYAAVVAASSSGKQESIEISKIMVPWFHELGSLKH